MNLSGIFSDDQMALVGCFLALAVCGLISMISFHFGPAGRKSRTEPGTVSLAGRTRSHDDALQDRRAA